VLQYKKKKKSPSIQLKVSLWGLAEWQ